MKQSSHSNKIINGLCLLLVYVSLSTTLIAQKIKVCDAVNHQPLVFVNIAIPSHQAGTLTDSLGMADLSFWQLKNYETINISYLGYEARQIIGSQLKQDSVITISLREIPTILKPLIISSKQKLIELGNDNRGFVMAGFKENVRGVELATLMDNKHKGYLSTVRFRVAKNVYDSVIFRINLYEVIDDAPGAQINTLPIYCKIAGKKGDYNIDVTQFNLQVSGAFMVSLEWLHNLDTRGLYFYASGFKKNSYARSYKEQVWEKIPLGISISSTLIPIEDE